MKDCIVCKDPAREALEKDILNGLPPSLIADRYSLPPLDLERHAHEAEEKWLNGGPRDETGMGHIYRFAARIEALERFALLARERGQEKDAAGAEREIKAHKRVLARITEGRSVRHRQEAV